MDMSQQAAEKNKRGSIHIEVLPVGTQLFFCV
jgi:hypothetical protein